ncbi:MAG: FG-GAP repeat protein [Sphingobacterium sp.]|nr:FG-GAP repeat protein [Sphingobacterium sp.]
MEMINSAGQLSLDGNRLAVGARLDDGFNNTRTDSGAVYLYSFSDNLFSGGNLEAIIGHGYTGGKNIDLALDTTDYFGWSVSLDGNRLAVGAYGDDGFNVGSNSNNFGAVYLYSFSDSLFSGGNLEAIIGRNYTGGKNINQALDISDYFGSSVSLSGNRLAIGAIGDDGFNNLRNASGAVYLYSFSDSIFSGGNLEAVIGDGYTGGKNINQALDISDEFAYSLSLNGNRLAVGARYDDGFNNSRTDSGAVYLYTFSDFIFSGGNLESIIGHGYTGGKNINLILDNNDQFGWAVSLDGNRLAVGARLDDGYNVGSTSHNPGAVYLYTFSDEYFSYGKLKGIIGSNYRGTAKDTTLNLSSFDNFGSSVSINGNSLAVGASGEDGYNNLYLDTGSVFLYSFSDSLFSNGSLQAIIGSGYTGGKNINLSLDAGDAFGSSVSLNNNRLAIGAQGDDGFENMALDTGAVYLYSFSDSMFSNGSLQGIIGSGYTGGKNINISLDDVDNFGSSVSLNGNRLAIGAANDDGFNNTRTNSGSVYLYSFL